MHNTTIPSLETDLIGIRIVSYVAFTTFGLISVCASVAVAQRVAFRKSAAPSLPLSRQALAVALLACGWLFAGLNPLLLDLVGTISSLMRVLLNAAAWEWTLAQLAEYYCVLEPTRSDTALPIRRAALVLLVLAACGNITARLVALIVVLPLAAVVLLCATLWSTAPDRAIWPLTRVPGAPDCTPLLSTGNVQVRFGHAVFAVLALAGLWALVAEMLSAEYSGALSLTASFALMLPEHAVLVMLWIATALMPAQPSVEGRLIGGVDSRASMDEPLVINTADNEDALQQ